MNNPFKHMLAQKDLPAGYPVGTWVMSASPVVAEAVGCAGFDWAVVDMDLLLGLWGTEDRGGLLTSARRQAP